MAVALRTLLEVLPAAAEGPLLGGCLAGAADGSVVSHLSCFPPLWLPLGHGRAWRQCACLVLLGSSLWLLPLGGWPSLGRCSDRGLVYSVVDSASHERLFYPLLYGTSACGQRRLPLSGGSLSRSGRRRAGFRARAHPF